MNHDIYAYLQKSPADETRGLYVTTAGIASVSAGSPYPPHQHPVGYQFDWQHGRVLQDYALVYITRGEGTFESHDISRKRVQAGDLIVVFPGKWHRYAPSPKTGWDEHWVVFGGDFATRLMANALFDPSRPVLRVGANETLHNAFTELAAILQETTPSVPSLAAAAAHRIIALVIHTHRLCTSGTPATAKREQTVQRAKLRMAEQLDQPLQMEALALELGISYSVFRHMFKQHTGLSPKAYMVGLRIDKARNLLTSTSLSVKEIAYQLSFDTPYYFMRLFKNKTGMTPTQWRTFSRGQTQEKG
jgi:AraC-like DNA-binding protein